jgi:hypothetical protein
LNHAAIDSEIPKESAAQRLGITHLKVVMLAFSCVTLVVGFGLVHSALPQEPISISTIVARVTGTIIRAF